MKRVYTNFQEMIKNREKISETKSSWLSKKFKKTFLRYHKLKKLKTKTNLLLNISKSIVYWGLAYFYKTPGLDIHRKIILLNYRLWRKEKTDFYEFYNNAIYPLDSVRYFEFDFFLKQLKNKTTLGNYLDVSSPRMLFTLLLKDYPDLKAEIVNPNLKDLEISKKLINNLGLINRCNFHQKLIEELDFANESFDTITSMSVIEHIPGDGDKEAVETLWKLLKPGGSLIISVPMCKQAYEEFIDIDFYGLLAKKDGYVFGQRFYDDVLLKELYMNMGAIPSSKAFYGEKSVNRYNLSREKKQI